MTDDRASASVARDAGTFDYVIVGAGSAGCLLANRLSADPAVTVLLLEAGGRDNYRWIHVPAGVFYTRNNPRVDWCFKTEEEAGLNGRIIGCPRGRVLGGSSALHGMLYLRGQARDYDQWRQLGNGGWGWDDVLPFFMKHEDYHGGADDLHGAGGECRVDGQRLNWEILDAFIAAAVEAGIPRTEDFNRGNNEGAAYYDVYQKRGRRVSAATAFLHPVTSRKNLTVLTDAQATRLRLEGKRVTGLELLQGGEAVTANATREVLLAAGTIGSPQLLELSGIGAGPALQRQGIEVRHELIGVGENLQDHLQLRFIYKVTGDVSLNRKVNSRLHRMGFGMRYLLTKGGPASMTPVPLGIFTKSDPALETPDLQYHAQPVSLDNFGDPMHPFPGFTATVAHLRPESRGSVHIKSPVAADQPAIHFNYLATEGDRQVALKAMKLTRRIMAGQSMANYQPEEYRPGPIHQSDDALLAAAGDIGMSIYHPVGTCKMGADNMAVVDERLRVRGLDGLRVVDASIMPTITSGNTNAPVTMIAEKASDMIREDWQAR